MDDHLSLVFDQLIRKRRSIRRYRPESPPEALIEQMVQCACLSPSPSNTHPVRFVNIRSQSIQNEMRARIEAGKEHFLSAAAHQENWKQMRNLINTYFRYSVWMFTAPVIMAVGVTKESTGFSRRLFEAGLLDQYDFKDPDITTGLSLSAFILKGETLGLGTCILTAPLVFMHRVQGMPGVADLYIRCFVTVGFPDEIPAPVERKTPAEIYRAV